MMNNTLCGRYNGKNYVVSAPQDKQNLYLLNFDDKTPNKEILITDPLLTDLYNTSFFFTLNNDVHDDSMPNTWELTPNVLDMEHSKLELIWQKDLMSAPDSSNLGILAVGFNDLAITRQMYEYFKQDGTLTTGNANDQPNKTYRDYSLIEWLQHYFMWQYKKIGGDENYIYSQCLKKQFASNPAYTLDMLLAPLNEAVKELQAEFPDDKNGYTISYLRQYTSQDVNILNEFRYYAHFHEYVPEYCAYNFMSITASKIANAFACEPYNAFVRLRHMVMGDTLQYLMQYLTAGNFKSLPELRRFLSR